MEVRRILLNWSLVRRSLCWILYLWKGVLHWCRSLTIWPLRHYLLVALHMWALHVRRLGGVSNNRLATLSALDPRVLLWTLLVKGWRRHPLIFHLLLAVGDVAQRYFLAELLEACWTLYITIECRSFSQGWKILSFWWRILLIMILIRLATNCNRRARLILVPLFLEAFLDGNEFLRLMLICLVDFYRGQLILKR